MKWMLLPLLGIVFIGCKEKGIVHKGICLTCPDTCATKFTNGVDLRGVDVPYWKQTMECDCGEVAMWNRTDDMSLSGDYKLGGALVIDTTSGLDYRWDIQRGDVVTFESESGTTPTILSIGAKRVIPIHTGSPEWLKEDTLTRGVMIKGSWRSATKTFPTIKHDTIYIYRDTCATDYNKPGEFQIELHENLNTKNK